ncbi:Imm32 family immunity protein [Microbispora rosea]|uniref:Imm32 family immunity protein n=1 Tax=Microbispora rosea TaxID=58117 RepID=UPI003D8D91BB
MPEIRLDVPQYEPSRGVRLVWDDEAQIVVSLDGDETVTISANVAGLRTLARHLLTLAQDGVSAGSHIHLDGYSGLEEESVSLIVERSAVD